MSIRITHLVDDFSAGGVMRGLDFLRASETLGPSVESTVVSVQRGALGAPKVEADVIVSHLSVSWRNLPLLIGLRARYSYLPIIHVEHSYSEGFVSENVNAERRFENLLRIAYALFTRVVAVSRAQAEWLKRRNLVKPESLRVISTSVDLAPFLALTPASGRNARVLGAVGRFHKQKGFDELIAAFRTAAMPGQILRLIGDGPEAHALREAAGGDSRIQFHPFTDNPAAAYAECDAIAVPSKWEPYGLVALEARAAGRPVLVANVDGLGDQASEGCIAVQPGRWAAAIAALPEMVNTARIAASRREAVSQNRRFLAGWRGLIEEATSATAPKATGAVSAA